MLKKLKLGGRNLFILTALSAALPFISSCKKDELTTPGTTLNSNKLSTMSAVSEISYATATVHGVTCEQWNNVSGNDVAQIPTSTAPSTTSTITTLEETSSQTPNYGRRLRGILLIPINGVYKFAISGDDAAEVWLSSTQSPANKVKIASTPSWTNFHEFTKYASQQSAGIKLVAGMRYYIEVLQKQGGGDSHLTVQWTMPNGTTECPIAGSRLTPYPSTTTMTAATTTTTSAAASSSTGTAYTASGVITYDGAHDITINGKSIAGGSTPCISLKNCYNVHVTNCKLYNSSDVGIYLFQCHNITVDYCYFTGVSTGVNVDHSSQGAIVIDNNQFLNMKGPFPKGQFVQFNNVNGAGNSVSNNKGENVMGSSNPEDAISIYQSNGTASSPIKVNGNYIRGGGPSASGGGIMLGDQGGSYVTASNNILVNPGQYGIAISGGNNNQILNNIIYGVKQSFTNVGIYVNSIGGYNVTNSTVSGNKVCFYNSTGYQNNVWLSSNAQKPTGWDTANTWGAALTAAVLPATLITYK